MKVRLPDPVDFTLEPSAKVKASRASRLTFPLVVVISPVAPTVIFSTLSLTDWISMLPVPILISPARVKPSMPPFPFTVNPPVSAPGSTPSIEIMSAPLSVIISIRVMLVLGTVAVAVLSPVLPATPDTSTSRGSVIV